MSQSISAEGDFRTLVGHDITTSKNTIDVTFETEGDIPENGSEGAFGYGLVTGTIKGGLPENVLALTTHLCASDSLEQGNAPVEDCPDGVIGLLEALGFPEGTNEVHDDATFHAHILDLKPSTDACDVDGSLGLEVDLQRTLQTQNNVSPDYDVDVDSESITVSDVPRGDLKSSSFKKASSLYFGITPQFEGNTITNLCLTQGLPAED
ncbi:MAG: hypothetical protein OEM17_04780 [Nitrosopumilus sp.]|nr:hypothetical protein [Nitrosopumilus sp.]